MRPSRADEPRRKTTEGPGLRRSSPKRLLRVALLLSALVPASVTSIAGAPGLAQEPDPFAFAAESASASWVVQTSRTRGTFYFAEARRSAGRRGLRLVAILGRGTCRIQKSRDFETVSCSGRGTPRPISLADFEMDPLLASARLLVRDERFVHEVRWTGRGAAPTTAQGASLDERGATANAGLARDADAVGRIFGQTLSTRGDPYAFATMERGAAAGLSVDDQATGRGARPVRVAFAKRYRR